MIVFHVEKLEDFLAFLPLRMNDYVFFDVQKDSKGEFDTKKDLHVVLHFLGNVNETKVLNCLYQTSIILPKTITKDTIFEEIKKVFDQTSIKFISGRISEMFYSVA